MNRAYNNDIVGTWQYAGDGTLKCPDKDGVVFTDSGLVSTKADDCDKSSTFRYSRDNSGLYTYYTPSNSDWDVHYRTDRPLNCSEKGTSAFDWNINDGQLTLYGTDMDEDNTTNHLILVGNDLCTVMKEPECETSYYYKHFIKK